LSFKLGQGDRAVFIGLPKSGKTNLEAALCASVKSLVVIDSKRHPEEWADWAKARGVLVTNDPAQINLRKDGQLVNPRIVIQVSSRALRDRAGWKKPGSVGWVWTEILEAIIARGRRVSTLVIFDEVLQTLPSGSAHPLAWEMYEQGRAFGLSIWAGSQIANRMETLVIRLAEHCFSFWMGNPKEQRLLADCRGLDCSVLSTLEQWHFAYQANGPRSQWTVCSPAPKVIGKVKSVAPRRSEEVPERVPEPIAE